MIPVVTPVVVLVIINPVIPLIKLDKAHMSGCSPNQALGNE